MYMRFVKPGPPTLLQKQKIKTKEKDHDYYGRNIGTLWTGTSLQLQIFSLFGAASI